MTRMTFKEMQELGGGSWSVDTYLGDFVGAFGSLRLPLRMESSAGGHHLEQLANLYWSLADLLGNVCQIYVYRDTSDSNVQFSVAGGRVTFFGVSAAYAGQINRGNLTAGATNYVWLDLRDPSSPTAGFGGGWPTYPHIKLATISMPASGPWRPNDLTRFGHAHALQPQVGGTGVIGEKTFTFSSGSPLLIGTVPAGARVHEVVLGVGTSFNGSGVALTVGDAGNNSRHLASGDNTPGTPGVYTKRNHHVYTGATDVSLYISPGSGATQGAGWVYVTYVRGV